MRSRKSSRRKSSNQTLLEQFMTELDRPIEDEQGGVTTKRQQLIETIINEGLKGDQRIQNSLLKLAEKYDAIKQEEEEDESPPPCSKAEWELTFAFFGKYKPLIEQEIERLKASNPTYWDFSWFRPTLETAPWYEDVHGGKAS